MDDLAAFLEARLADDGRPVVTERMRREIAAKRAILAAYVSADGDSPRDRDRGRWDALHAAVRHLAAIWDDHSGYRPEWRP